MDLKSLTQTYIPAIETELQKQVARLDQPHTRLFHEMLTYHMGWTGEGAGPEATGKRIRPLMVLLTTAAYRLGRTGSMPCLPRRLWNWCIIFHLCMMIFKTTPKNDAGDPQFGHCGARRWRSMLAMHCLLFQIKRLWIWQKIIRLKLS